MKQTRGLSVFMGAVLLTLAAALVTACASASGGTAGSGTANPLDLEWGPVTEPSQIVGQWEGSSTVIIPRNDAAGMPQSSLLVILTFTYEAGAEEMATITTVSLEQLLTDLADTDDMKEKGQTPDLLWALFSQQFLTQGIETESGYRVLMGYEGPVEEFIDSGSDGTILISADGEQLHLIFDSSSSFGFGDEGLQDITLTQKH
jgi:hypothetical protein